MIEIIIPELLRSIFEARVYADVTPDVLPKDANGNYLPMAIYQDIGGSEQLYVDQTWTEKENALVQITVVAPHPLVRKQLSAEVFRTMAGSGYPVEVVGGPVGGYDDSRQLYSATQRFGIWFTRPTP